MTVTGAVDLATEILEFIHSNWNENSFSPKPTLHHGNDKHQYPDDGTLARDHDLKQADVVTVTYDGRTNEPIGTEFDYDIEAEVDVRIEAVTHSNGGVERNLDFRQLVDETRRTINVERSYPLPNPGGRYSYRDLRITNESTEPIEEDNRDFFNEEFTVLLRGYESLPDQ